MRLLSYFPQWGTVDAEMKVPLVGAHGYQWFPLVKPGVGQDIALSALRADKTSSSYCQIWSP